MVRLYKSFYSDRVNPWIALLASLPAKDLPLVLDKGPDVFPEDRRVELQGVLTKCVWLKTITMFLKQPDCLTECLDGLLVEKDSRWAVRV
jgi:hypothetical protein